MPAERDVNYQYQDMASEPMKPQMRLGIQEHVANVEKTYGVTPHLRVLLDNPDFPPSVLYTNLKEKVLKDLGMHVTKTIVRSKAHLEEEIELANESRDIHGVMLQLPSLTVMDPLELEEYLKKIKEWKDVDGLGSTKFFDPATPRAIIDLLEFYGVDIRNARIFQRGRGKLVGKALERMFLARGASNLIATDINTDPELVEYGLNNSNVYVTAIGKPDSFHPGLFKNMSIPRMVVDAGTAEKDSEVKGDVSVEFRRKSPKKSIITPEKGGVGPVTILELGKAVVEAADLQHSNPDELLSADTGVQTALKFPPAH